MMEKSSYIQVPDEVGSAGSASPKPARSPRPRKRFRISKMERLLYGSFLVTIVFLTLVSIGTKNGYSVSQQNLQKVNQKVTQVHSDNGNLKQEISELQSSSRLQKIANQNGLSLSNNNIRNVRK